MKKLVLILALSMSMLTTANDGMWATMKNYELDTLTAFTIPASIIYYLMAKRSPESVRENAALMVYDYEHNRGIYEVQSLRDAYYIVDCTDEQLAKKMWWEQIGGSFLTGLAGAGLYLMFKYPSSVQPGIYFNVGGGSSGLAMPFHR